ncbi:MAG TPA: vitamin B12-dependent ribonucleotide reductase, partial [Ignavibacteriales bacterium]|nr:vitamin B12-dependent ribonucleotide reductase [Ignavibacteriales bacterium]
VIDYIFRELAVTYLGRNDLAHVDPNETKSPSAKKKNEPEFISEELVSERFVELDKEEVHKTEHVHTAEHVHKPAANVPKANGLSDKIKEAREKGYTGDICVECHSMTMVRNGTCLKCMTCGSTSGCS